MTQPDRPPMAIEYGAFVLRAGYQRLQTHTQNFKSVFWDMRQCKLIKAFRSFE